jgi:Icc-related predicted phosphoesterase
VRLVHFSDMHATFVTLPPADVYVCTGDMYPDLGAPVGGWGVSNYEMTTPLEKKMLQMAWSLRNPFRARYGIPDDAPVVCVRGNHDFYHLAGWVGGEVYEFDEDPLKSVNVGGIHFGGFRGIPIIGGGWNDQIREDEFLRRCNSLPSSLDVLLTHVPPAGILDDYNNQRCGSYPVRDWVLSQSRIYGGGHFLRLHAFGHVHSDAGVTSLGTTKFSNASETFHVIDI